MLMRAALVPLVTALTAVVALGGAPSGQQPPPQQQQQQQSPPPAPLGQDPQQRPTFKSGINFVRVDVIVSDKKGNPVLDLKPEDFQVFEDGTRQKVEQFDIIKIDPIDQAGNARFAASIAAIVCALSASAYSPMTSPRSDGFRLDVHDDPATHSPLM